MFMTCPNKCGIEMRDILLKEKSIEDMFEGVKTQSPCHPLPP